MPHPEIGCWASPEDIAIKGTATFFPCSFDRCQGLNVTGESGNFILDEVFTATDPDKLCKTGYSREQCGTCARHIPRNYSNPEQGPFDDWCRIGTFCAQCEARDDMGARWAVFLLEVVAIFALWCFINALAATYLDNLDLTLAFLQMTSTIHSFSLSWPTMIQPLVVACIFADFDLDVLSPSCILDDDIEWRSEYDLLLQLIFPPLLFIGLIVRSWHVTYGIVNRR